MSANQYYPWIKDEQKERTPGAIGALGIPNLNAKEKKHLIGVLLGQRESPMLANQVGLTIIDSILFPGNFYSN